MDLTQLDQLKTLLVEGTDFQAIMNSFFDFAEQPGFFDQGEKIEAPKLLALVEMVGTQLLKTCVLDSFLPVGIANYHFVHAGGTLNGRLLSLIYFEDIDCGLMAVMVSPTTAQFARVTCKNLPIDFELRN